MPSSQLTVRSVSMATDTRNRVLICRLNVPPPPGALINFQNGAPVLDKFGNNTGGARSPYLDVPTAQCFAGSPGSGLNFLTKI
jgi:hypothetical protein